MDKTFIKSTCSLVIFYCCVLVSTLTFAGETYDVTWPNKSMTFHISELGGENDIWQFAFEEAAFRWNDTSADFIINIEKNPGSNFCSDSGLNGAKWSQDSCGDEWGENTLAITSFWHSETDLIKADILFNDTIAKDRWEVYDGNSKGSTLDFRRTAVHELGHAIGLDHSNVNGAIMEATVGNIFLPQEDDIITLSQLYGGSILPPEKVEVLFSSVVDEVRLIWSAVESASHYEIYACESGNQFSQCDNEPIARPTSNSYTYMVPLPGLHYTYQIKACDNSSCSFFSNTVATSTEMTVPQASNGLTDLHVSLSWNAATGASHYKVYRCSFTYVSTCDESIASPSSNSYLDTDATPGTIYYYRIEACNNTHCGNISSYDAGFKLLSTSPSLLSQFKPSNFVNLNSEEVSYSGAGDVNNDGYSDIIIGDYNYESSSSTRSGRVFILSGLDARPLYELEGTEEYLNFGSSVSNAGDVNNDGFADIIVGAPGNSSISGNAFVFSGMDGTLLLKITGNKGESFARSVSSAGDVNNDSYDDLIIESDFGQIRIFSGIDGTRLHQFFYLNRNPNDISVSAAGDVNNDGFDDIIIGNSTDSSFLQFGGSAKIFSGIDGSELYTFSGDRQTRLGVSVSSAGDVNNDGYADVIIGANGSGYDQPTSGEAHVYSGADGSLLHKFSGTGAFGEFGTKVSGINDLNGDGYDDLMVLATDASRQKNGGDYDYDHISIYSGLDGHLLSLIVGENFSDVSDVGDTNNDGFNDILLTERFYSSGDYFTLRFLYSGNFGQGVVPLKNLEFEDLALEKCVHKYAIANNWLTLSEMTELTCTNLDIKSSVGIEQLTYLNNLNLSGNLLREINIDLLVSLNQLNLQNNLLSSPTLDYLSNIQTENNITISLFSYVTNDFNNDRNTDILLRQQNSGGWYLYQLEDNNIISEDYLQIQVGTDYQYRSSDDFNADGNADLLLRNSSGQWLVYLLSGNEVLETATINATNDTNWQFLSSADYNRDGNADLLLRHTSGIWYVYYLNGSTVIGGDQIQASSDIAWEFQDSGDYNGDGWPDILIRHKTDGRWYLYNIKSALIIDNSAPSISTDTDWIFQTSANYDTDTTSDLLLRHKTTGRWALKLFDNFGLTNSTANPIAITNDLDWEFQSSGDFNKDDKGDVLLRHRSTGEWKSYYLDAHNIVDDASINASTDLNWVFSANTFEGESILNTELLMRHSTGLWYVASVNDTTVEKTQSLPATNDSNWHYQSNQDFNGDGKQDLLLRHTTGLWYVYYRELGSIIGGDLINATTDSSWTYQSSGDYNGDGKPDLLLRHSSGLWYVYYLDGKDIIGGDLLNATSDTNWSFQSSSDFNADGKADLLIRHTTGLWYVYYFDGANSIGGDLIEASTDPNWTLQASSDFNGDGHVDLLIRHTSGYWHLYTLTGSTISSSNPILATNDPNWKFQSSQDFNGDNKADLLLQHSTGYWYLYKLDGSNIINSANLPLSTDVNWHYLNGR